MRNVQHWWRRASSVPGLLAGIVIFNAVLIAAVWVAAFELERNDREGTIRDAIARNDNLAIAFEQYVTRTIESADAAVRFLTREYLRNGRKQERAALAAESAIENKAISGIVLADAGGQAFATALKGLPSRSFNVADREHFKVHIAHGTSGVYIGKTVLGRAAGTPVIPISRRITTDDGAFGGVAIATIDPARLTEFFFEAKLGALDVISAVKLSGTTLARLKGGRLTWGHDISRSRLFAELAKAPSGQVLAPGHVDGVPRYFSYRTLPDYQIVVIVGTAEADVLAEFLGRQRVYMMTALLASLCITSFTIALVAATRGRYRVEMEQRETQKIFRTIFEKAGTGMALVDKDDGRIMRCNAALAAMLGYSEVELCRLRVADLSDDEQYQEDRNRWQQMLEGTSSSFQMEKRYRRKDGSLMWGMLTSTMVRHEDGTPQFIIGMVEDISNIKASQEEVQRRNQYLRHLSQRLMTAVEVERRNLGRELHDRTGANLSAVLLSLDMLQDKLPPPVATVLASQLDTCKSLLRETINQVRLVLADLRPAALDDLGLLAALSHCIMGMKSVSGFDIILEGREPVPRAPPEVEIALFRIAQEAMHNAIRHSRADRITVSLWPNEPQITLMVQDYGCGFDVSRAQQGSGHLGMITMRERSDAIGAEMRIESVPDEGTCITVMWRRDAVTAMSS